jgi:pyocin large subunit-like protein
MSLKTNGFDSVENLRRHFSEHGDEFGTSNTEEYEAFADGFLGGPATPDIRQCFRKCGHMLRYDPKTEAFGILADDGIILTCYKPVPCAKVPFMDRETTRLAGRCHKEPNNLVYFSGECKK